MGQHRPYVTAILICVLVLLYFFMAGQYALYQAVAFPATTACLAALRRGGRSVWGPAGMVRWIAPRADSWCYGGAVGKFDAPFLIDWGARWAPYMRSRCGIGCGGGWQRRPNSQCCWQRGVFAKHNPCTCSLLPSQPTHAAGDVPQSAALVHLRTAAPELHPLAVELIAADGAGGADGDEARQLAHRSAGGASDARRQPTQVGGRGQRLLQRQEVGAMEGWRDGRTVVLVCPG